MLSTLQHFEENGVRLLDREIVEQDENRSAGARAGEHEEQAE